MIFVIWLVSFFVCIAPLLGWKDPNWEVRLRDKKCIVSQDIYYQIFATASSFYLPLMVILILYWRIFQTARKRIRRRQVLSKNNEEGAKNPAAGGIAGGLAAASGTDALKLVEPIVTEVKVIVAHFKKSSAANDKLLQYQKNLGTSCPKKLEFHLCYVTAICEIGGGNTIDNCSLKHCVTYSNVKRIGLDKKLVDTLRTFETVTPSVSGEKYITASLVIIFTGGLISVMEEMITSGELKSDLSNQIIGKLKHGPQTRFYH
ncbi:unnamed protein product [Diabrotica balteata]|uniref:G-protein coupled receptors family 1 profile domain-containing protein n=1 Tax=Diabrotica balteata TaxID=107213 RepID=A0A9N9T700_DIABA|nr:unnamed protein product [Diabrotica balteata]